MYEHLRDESRWILPEVLSHQAGRRGEAPFVTMVGSGETLTYSDARRDAERVAGCFAALDVNAHDPVAVMLPNGLDFVRTWLGLGCLGATLVALNTELQGAFLEHQLENSGARVALVHETCLDRLKESAPRLTHLRTVLVAGDRSPTDSEAARIPFLLRPFSDWRSSPPYRGAPPKARDIACIMYTSGTTGPAKGVLMPHAHCYLFGLGTIDNLGLTERDRYYIVLPLFHANGLFMQLYATLIAGASAVLRDRFSASMWLSDVRRYEATVSNMLGAVAAFVVAQPPSPQDCMHRLRVVSSAPLTAEHEQALRDRFSIPEVVALYGMTEVNIPLYGAIGSSRPGTCGRLYDRYFELEIRDPETDRPVPAGAVGEIMVRPKSAFGIMAGYCRMPEKTVDAWRNLWFHTGDAALMESDGYVRFVDRMKDCIRRRGENISSYEVEEAVRCLPGVEEVAAYGVPSDVPGGEEEIMLAVVPSPGARLEPETISRYAERVLPRYARPRFIEVLGALPKTPTAKVQKGKLRERGIGPGTWDRDRSEP